MIPHMPVPNFCDVDVWLSDAKSWLSHPLAQWTMHLWQFVAKSVNPLSKFRVRSFLKDERMNGWTDGQVENIMPGSWYWRRHNKKWGRWPVEPLFSGSISAIGACHQVLGTRVMHGLLSISRYPRMMQFETLKVVEKDASSKSNLRPVLQSTWRRYKTFGEPGLSIACIAYQYGRDVQTSVSSVSQKLSREAARCFVSLNITHGIQGHSRSWKTVPFKSLCIPAFHMATTAIQPFRHNTRTWRTATARHASH